MYETFMNTVRRFFTPEGFFGFAGDALSGGKMKMLVILAFLVAITGLVLWSAPAFREWFRRLAARGGWRGILVAIPAGLYKLLLVLLIARFLMVAMGYQARVFEHEHGRLTEKNRSAVLMKWGSPHEQRELHVSFTRKRTWMIRQLKLPDEIDHEGRVIEGRIFSESYWKDEEQPVQAVEGKLPNVISTREDERDVAVEQRSIRSADVAITVVNNPRRLGNANYAGYEDTWLLKYLVANEQDEPITAHMKFRLPNDRDLYNDFRLTVDAEDMIGRVKPDGAILAWEVDLEPGQKVAVDIGYNSRGLEHLRYVPKRMTPTGHYRVAVTIKGIPGARMDYPIGSMPAAETLQEMTGDAYTLHWMLDNALTSYDIGLKLPEARQPNYHIAHLMDEAPLGLAMILVLLIVPRLASGRSLSVPVVLMVSIAYYLFYTFMGRLADVVIGGTALGFTPGFLVSAAVLLAVVAFFRSRDRSGRFLPVQDVAAFAVLVIGYPLAVISEDTAFWMQLFYIALLFYVCVLIAKYAVQRMVGTAPADQ